MRTIVDDLYQIIHNKKPYIIDSPSTLEQLEAELLNKNCYRILSIYSFQNLPKTLKNIDTEMYSLYYLLRDLFICLFIFIFGIIFYLTLIKTCNFFIKSIFIIIYGLISGTAITSLLVISHECMHGILFKNQSINNIVGYIIHTLMSIPYYSLCFSHAKHHSYVNHLHYGENNIPYNIENTDKDLYTYIKIFILRCKCRLYIYNKGLYAIINIMIRLIFGLDIYLLFNIGGGRIDYKSKRNIKYKLLRDHYSSNSALFLESQKSLVRFSTISISIIRLLTLVAFNYDSTLTVCFYIFPRVISNAWLILYSWIAHTDVNIPYHGSDTFNKFKSDVSAISSSYGTFLDHIHHHIGYNASIHHLCPTIPHYLCKLLVPTIKNNILSKETLVNMFNKLDDIYPTYQKLIMYINSCSDLINKLGIIVDTRSNKYFTKILEDLETLNNTDFFRKKCLIRCDINIIENLRIEFINVIKCEKKLNDIFCEFGLMFTIKNLIDIANLRRQNLLENDNLLTDNIITLKKFVDMYTYKENTIPIFKKLVQNSIMCTHIDGSLDKTIYYKGLDEL